MLYSHMQYSKLQMTPKQQPIYEVEQNQSKLFGNPSTENIQ